ncbi:hypothetical protein H5410_059816 [Solanum commersonii]|uniref:Leucine-rich repeat-containing N-terminal plant-type domain-containing protein n=1 Tax=Solanum commersonii TaxID=4109 RepID=A0A9J5W3I9_SOLCO|nr:hypothetical protein H5410_059816 [Solanum commersonii]
MEGVAILSLLIVVIISYGFSCVQTSEIHCIESEKNALIKFSQGFKNPSRNMLSWRLDGNCCQWKGVECDNTTGHVITLDLQKQFLQGEFRISLLGLPHLRHLDMSQIDFQGAHIPDFISSFKNLEFLNLSKTNFRGEIPENLSNLSRLQFLDLSGYYSLRVNSLKWIQPLSSMKILDLSGVNMRSAENWLHDINMLSCLSELRLSACQLTTFPELLPSFVNFASLQILDLSSNYFNTRIPSWLFSTCHNLVYLNLSRSWLNGSLPNAFGNMSSLRVLDLSENSLLGILSHSFEKMSSLSFLNLSRNSFTGYLPPTLPSKLKYLDISDNQMEGPLERSITQLKQLVVLNVAWNSFNDSITEHFLNFTDLRVLDLSSNSFILNWLQTQKELSFIDISRVNISGEVPDWFWNFSAKVNHIDLSHNYFRGEVPEFTDRVHLTKLDLSDNNFHGPLPHFSPNMMTLILARNSFNGEIPHSIGELANLFFLQLQNNSFSKNLPSSLENVSGLKILDVSENSLSGKIPIWLGESLSTLEILKLSRNRFDGIIPREICQLKYLYLLDLSSNALSGVIPRCVDNLRTMSGEEEAPSFTYGPYADYRIPGMLVLKGNSYDIFFHWFIKVIDLSDNHLSGDIPEEITSLTALRVLNLSRNNFTGTIPRYIHNMQNLEFLDLSRNKLSCTFPPDIIQLLFLRL